MIGKLVFKLPEEQSEFRLAQNGWKYKGTLQRLAEEIRAHDKHGNGKTKLGWDQIKFWFYEVLAAEECDIHADD